MNTTNFINRPWYSSFSFHDAIFSDKRLEQIHKLTRNFIASLDLGCPSAKHVPIVGAKAALHKPTLTEQIEINLLSEQERYLLWVRQWKDIYTELSALIRELKTWRRTVRLTPLPAARLEALEKARRGSDQHNLSEGSYRNHLAARHLVRLQETAQIMLNARWNAKLAAAELRRRRIAAEGTFWDEFQKNMIASDTKEPHGRIMDGSVDAAKIPGSALISALRREEDAEAETPCPLCDPDGNKPNAETIAAMNELDSGDYKYDTNDKVAR